MDLTEISKAVRMYNIMHDDAPITEKQANDLLTIWVMVHGQMPTMVELPPPAPVEKPVIPDVTPVAALPETPAAPPKAEQPSSQLTMVDALAGELLPKSTPQLREVPGTLFTTDPRWPQGMTYRIAMTPRTQHRDEQTSGYIYFSRKPEQENFDECYVLFQEGTHNVHVHHREYGGIGRRWEIITITDEYCSWRHPTCGCYGDSFDVNPAWTEHEARYRIKYKNTGALPSHEYRYVYFTNNPAHDTVNDYTRRHRFAVLEKRDDVMGA